MPFLISSENPPPYWFVLSAADDAGANHAIEPLLNSCASHSAFLLFTAVSILRLRHLFVVVRPARGLPSRSALLLFCPECPAVFCAIQRRPPSALLLAAPVSAPPCLLRFAAPALCGFSHAGICFSRCPISQIFACASCDCICRLVCVRCICVHAIAIVIFLFICEIARSAHQ